MAFLQYVDCYLYIRQLFISGVACHAGTQYVSVPMDVSVVCMYGEALSPAWAQYPPRVSCSLDPVTQVTAFTVTAAAVVINNRAEEFQLW